MNIKLIEIIDVENNTKEEILEEAILLLTQKSYKVKSILESKRKEIESVYEECRLDYFIEKINKSSISMNFEYGYECNSYYFCSVQGNAKLICSNNNLEYEFDEYKWWEANNKILYRKAHEPLYEFDWDDLIEICYVSFNSIRALPHTLKKGEFHFYKLKSY